MRKIIEMQEKDPKDKKFELFGKNEYFYYSGIFTIIVSIITFLIVKALNGTSYSGVGIAVLIVIIVALNKLKEYLDEKDPSSTLGKFKTQINNLEKEITDKNTIIEDKQSRINTLVSQIHNTEDTESFNNLKKKVISWYINTDNECYYSAKDKNQLQQANKRSQEDLAKFLN